jgi:hypothetical protein
MPETFKQCQESAPRTEMVLQNWVHAPDQQKGLKETPMTFWDNRNCFLKGKRSGTKQESDSPASHSCDQQTQSMLPLLPVTNRPTELPVPYL